MQLRETTQETLRFSVFEFDPKTRILYRKGSDTGLEEQPAHVLELLLIYPGRIVSREEIKTGLWPNDRSGDLDDRINHAIRSIREVLRDDPKEPRYIETVPKRGYRFITRLESGDGQVGSPSSHQSSPSNGKVTTEGTERASHSKKSLALLAAGGAIVIVALVVALLRAGQSRHPAITSVTPIRPRPDQTIVIRGRHFGRYAPYSHTDSPYLAIRDKTAQWAAGRIMERNFDAVMLSVASWNDSEIIVTAFSGMYGDGSWKLNPGDTIEVAVWNPQSGAGPAKFRVRVTGVDVQR